MRDSEQGTRDSSPLSSIRAFWEWFGSNSTELRRLYEGRNYPELTEKIGRELDKVDPELAWEMGPGLAASFLLTISSEGHPNLKPLADKMVEMAPALNGWEFRSSKPARNPPAVVSLVDRGVKVSTQSWRFVPVERPDTGRIDLIISDEDLARLADSNREAAFKAVTLYLDQALGEDTVEAWIGRFEIRRSDRTVDIRKKSYKIEEISDYVYWATNREVDPLRHGGLGPSQKVQ